MTVASYDVTFTPMVNVAIRVKNPKKPTKKELADILRLAAVKIALHDTDYLSEDNLDSVALYSSDVAKGADKEKTTIL